MNSAILTIDDISSKNTPAIVDYLKEKGITAVLFAVGANVEKFYGEAIYAVQAGMIVGNHSYSHPSFSSISLEQGIAEIEKCEAVLDKLYEDAHVTRQYRPFRFPYGDRGGENEQALQKYLADKGFDKLDDGKITYPWWSENSCNQNIDTFWTFDFEEYRIYLEDSFKIENVWNKMNNRNPAQGAALFGKENHHFVLLHAHDETEAIIPQYYKKFIDYALENGLTFEKPRFK